MADAQHPLEALERGRAWVDLGRTHHRFQVSGADAATWLGDLVTGPVAGLAEGQATRSLLLTPTGRIRADLWVGRLPGDRFLLLQGLDQPESVDALLARYVLSSDVTIAPHQDGVVSLPAPISPPAIATWVIGPSPLDEGCRVIGLPSASNAEQIVAATEPDLIHVDAAIVDAWRIRQGLARFPADLSSDSFPAEDPAAQAAIDTTKGCFLGQESVAKIRNLGHPTHLVRAFRGPAGVSAGDQVLPAEEGEPPVGLVTSATSDRDGGTAVIARIRWPGSPQAPAGLRTSLGGLESRTSVR